MSARNNAPSCLCSLFGLLGISCSLLATASVSLESTESSLGSVNLNVLDLTNSSEFVFALGLLKREDFAGNLVLGSSRLELLSGGIVDKTLLWLVSTAWEQDHLGLVRVESLSVELELLVAGVSSSVIDRDSDGAGEAGTEASSLKLIKSKSTAVSNLASVAAGARRDDWAELLDWAGEFASSLGRSALISSELLGRLIEVAFRSALPVLSEMHVGN